jgi:hypothetical protein
MQMRFPLISTLIISSLTANIAVAAAFELGASAELMYFNYEEFDTTGDTLNTEIGFLPGVTVTAAHPFRAINNTFEFSLYGGRVDYDGQTQSGQPHQTETNETIYRLLYRLSWAPLNDQGELYAKAYWQQWDRSIQPNNGVSGLFEQYQWWSFEAGGQLWIYSKPGHKVFIDLGILVTRNGTIMVDLSNAGYGEPVLDLGDGLGLNSAINYRMAYTANGSFDFGLRYATWNFDRSNVKTISNGSTTISIVEPDSTTQQLTLTIGYTHNF